MQYEMNVLVSEFVRPRVDENKRTGDKSWLTNINTEITKYLRS